MESKGYLDYEGHLQMPLRQESGTHLTSSQNSQNSAAEDTNQPSHFIPTTAK